MRIELAFLIFIGLASCGNFEATRKLKTNKNGRVDVILDNYTNDTIEKQSFHENGKRYCIVPYSNNMVNGLIREYSDEGLLVNRRAYINNRLLLMESYYRDVEGRDSLIVTFRRVTDSLQRARDFISIRDGEIDGKNSYAMKVFPEKDTISINESYNFNLKLYTGTRDSVFHEVLIGPIDVHMNLQDTLLWQSGWNQEFTFSLAPTKLGYNHLFGKIKKIIIQSELNNLGLDSAFFYTDFYVTE